MRIFELFILLILFTSLISMSSDSRESPNYLDRVPDHLHAIAYEPVIIDLGPDCNEVSENRSFFISWGDGQNTGTMGEEWSNKTIFSHYYMKSGLYTIRIGARNESGTTESKNVTLRCYHASSPLPPVTIKDYIYPMDILFWTFSISFIVLFLLILVNTIIFFRNRSVDPVKQDQSHDQRSDV